MEKYKYLNKLFYSVMFLAATQFALLSCDDDPGVENYYTSKAEYASDFLKNRDQFSEFSQIVTRTTIGAANVMDLLGTWGSYTVFAPTNEAVEKYLHSRGLTSIDQLSQEDCDTITRNHIIEQAFFTTDYNEGVYPKMNMLDRPLSVTSIAVDENGNPIEKEETESDEEESSSVIPLDQYLAVYVNHTAKMIQMDDSVENGVVHTIDAVIGPKNDMITDLLSTDERVSTFYEALTWTGLENDLQKMIDENYTIGSDSIDWTNNSLVFSTASEYDNVAYMEHRYFKFTAFVETNDVYEKYGVHNAEDLAKLAKQIYDPKYPEDADITDYKDRRNSLNRFISYHFLPFQAEYWQLTCVDGPNSTLAKNFNRAKWDISDWYETMMPYSIMKFSFPSGSESGLYINRRGVQSRADGRGFKYRGAKITPPGDAGKDMMAINGIYHYIDDIISYGVQPDGTDIQDYVFSERLRIDGSTLSPDFMNSGARGHYTRSSYENGKYGIWDNNSTADNKQTCLGFKSGFVTNFEFNDKQTHFHVRPRTLSFWSYQGDELTIVGRFDVTVKLPPVPAGDWELRMFTCVGFNNRGIVQYYIDNVPQGIPFDMRPSGSNAKIGWKSDSDLGSEEQIAAFDKEFHNRQWMKGMKSYGNATSEAGGTMSEPFRNRDNTLRKVIGVFHSDGKTDHYLRIQQKMESDKNTCNFDMIELCPSTVYANPDVAEDRW